MPARMAARGLASNSYLQHTLIAFSYSCALHVLPGGLVEAAVKQLASRAKL